jgi:oligoendopeptidase F
MNMTFNRSHGLLTSEPQKNASIVPMKRSDVPVEQTWDLTTVFADDNAWEKAFLELKSKRGTFSTYQGQLHSSAETLLEAIRVKESIEMALGKLFVYAFHRSDEDTANTHYIAMKGRMGDLAAELMGGAAWFEPEVASIPERTLQHFMDELLPLCGYRHFFENIIRQKPYQLEPNEESLLARAAHIFSGSAETYGILCDADMTFKPIKDENGNKVDLIPSTYGVFLESRTRRVRRDAFRSMYETFGQFRNTCASTLSNTIKMNTYIKNVRRFKTGREAALFEDAIPESVYDSLIEAVHDHLSLLHRYVRLRKRILGVSKLHSYDLYVSLVEDVDQRYTVDEAKEILFKALAPLGSDYIALLHQAFDERWIDWAPNIGKRSGAYSGGSYCTNPFVLMNWHGTLDNLYTLAHELGHSCHSKMTRQTQPYVYGNYSIFLAEIASTCNEVLLTAYLLDHAEDDKVKAYVLNHFLDGFKGTVFRQTQFAEFEHLIHQADEKGVALTAEYLSLQYAELNQKYYGKSLNADPEIALEWARIPHFYYNYYVFQYATGYAAATALADAILTEGQGAVDRYLEFLSSGSSDWPIDTLKRSGVDMTNKDTIVRALDVFERQLRAMENLIG